MHGTKISTQGTATNESSQILQALNLWQKKFLCYLQRRSNDERMEEKKADRNPQHQHSRLQGFAL